MEHIEKEFKLIFNPGVARQLIRMGINVADIKSDRTNSDKTIFVFKRTEEFEKAFTEINSALKNKKAE